MDLLIIMLCSVFVACIGISIGLLINLRTIMKRIFRQLHELDTKLNFVPFPRNEIINLEKFALTLKKIVSGIRSIRPKID